MFCKNCGKESADGAAVCMGCGCPISPETPPVTVAPAGTPKKTGSIVFAAIIAVAVIVALAIGLIMMNNSARAEEIADALEGQVFGYLSTEDNYYAICVCSSGRKFKYTYQYANIMNDPQNYEGVYSVHVSLNGEIILKCGYKKFIVNVNNYGRIVSITDKSNPDQVLKP